MSLIPLTDSGSQWDRCGETRADIQHKTRDHNLDWPKSWVLHLHTTCWDVRWWQERSVLHVSTGEVISSETWELKLSENFRHLEIETGAGKKHLRHLLNQNSLPSRQKVSMIGAIRARGHYSFTPSNKHFDRARMINAKTLSPQRKWGKSYLDMDFGPK